MFKKLLLILNKTKLTQGFYYLVFLSVFGSLMEILSVSSLLPLIGILFDNNNIINEIPFIEKLIKYINIEPQNIVLNSIFIIILIFSFKFLFQIFFEWIRSKYTYDLDHKVSSYLFNFYLNESYFYHLNVNSSKLHRNILSDTKSVVNIFRSYIVMTSDLLIVINLFFLLFYINYKITLSSIFLLIAAGLIFLFLTHNINFIIGKKIRNASEKRIKYLISGFEGIKELIIYDKIKIFFQKFDIANKILSVNNSHSAIIQSLPKIIIEYLIIIGILISLAILFLKGEEVKYMLSILSFFLVVFIRVGPSIFRIISSRQQIRVNKASVDYLYKEFNYPKNNIEEKKIIIPSENKNRLIFKEKINFRNVTFKYEKNKRPILDKINIDIKNNDCIGIYGESGSGKSTFLNILAGLIRPTSGKVLVDGKNIFNKEKSWRRNIGYVSQNTFLIDEDLYTNISLNFNRFLWKQDNFKYAIENSGLKKEEKKFNLRKIKKLGEKGKKISIGQLQRIGIARALYDNPNLLILDEATSSLDINTEKQIIDTINDLIGKKTIIIVSHKLYLLKKCNKIFYIKNSKIYSKKYNEI